MAVSHRTLFSTKAHFNTIESCKQISMSAIPEIMALLADYLQGLIGMAVQLFFARRVFRCKQTCKVLCSPLTSNSKRELVPHLDYCMHSSSLSLISHAGLSDHPRTHSFRSRSL
jgi:hypothetical protein